MSLDGRIVTALQPHVGDRIALRVYKVLAAPRMLSLRLQCWWIEALRGARFYFNNWD